MGQQRSWVGSCIVHCTMSKMYVWDNWAGGTSECHKEDETRLHTPDWLFGVSGMFVEGAMCIVSSPNIVHCTWIKDVGSVPMCRAECFVTPHNTRGDCSAK
uniref:Uncharacterized protein n=1 Tax=Eutreptiella gymnastica TaxID=73025 RepID=A0A7S4GJ19_9EUGL